LARIFATVPGISDSPLLLLIPPASCEPKPSCASALIEGFGMSYGFLLEVIRWFLARRVKGVLVVAG